MQSSSALFGTFSPLTPTYWADARAQLKNVRMLTLAGIITAASHTMAMLRNTKIIPRGI